MTHHDASIRNAIICQRYCQGETQAVLAYRFDITKARVGQILTKAGLTMHDRPREVISPRNGFIGVRLTTPVKAALTKVAEREQKSISTFTADLIVTELHRRKVKI